MKSYSIIDFLKALDNAGIQYYCKDLQIHYTNESEYQKGLKILKDMNYLDCVQFAWKTNFIKIIVDN